jgi:hypothetical protein
MRGKREAMALTIGIPLMVAAMSWAQVAFLSARQSPPVVIWAAFEFSLAWLVAGLVSGHLMSGFRRRALGVFVACLAMVAVLHLIGWLLAGPVTAFVMPRWPAAPRPMVEMTGYYMGIALMVTAVVEDLDRAWKRREAGAAGGLDA